MLFITGTQNKKNNPDTLFSTGVIFLLAAHKFNPCILYLHRTRRRRFCRAVKTLKTGSSAVY